MRKTVERARTDRVKVGGLCQGELSGSIKKENFITRQRKIFYGWWVAIALFIVGMLSPMGRYMKSEFFRDGYE